MIARRDFLGGLGAATVLPAAANAASRDPLKSAAYRQWVQIGAPPAAPLGQSVTTDQGRVISLRDWLEGRPTVLVLWASWCGPCMSEKGAQGQLQERLIKAGSRARIKSLQSYDNKSLAEGKAFVSRLGGGSLDLARASRPMEKAFQTVFGKSPVDPSRISLPSMLLLDAQGREIGRHVGTMETKSGASYWTQKTTFDFLDAWGRPVQA